MKLRLSSLGAIVADCDGIASLRARDTSGAFGILPQHADFLTVLELGIVSWQLQDGSEHHCAVRRGVLSVQGGDVAIATREAIADDNLEHLETTVLQRLRTHDEAERGARTESAKLELQTIRELLRYLQPSQSGVNQ